MLDELLNLPIKAKIYQPFNFASESSFEGPFERQLQSYLLLSHSNMPTINQAELLRAAAGVRKDQRMWAEYVIGMIWLSWRYERAMPLLESALADAADFLSSVDYLHWLRTVELYKNLPLFALSRNERQSWAELEREARLIVYLKTGRLL